MESFDLEDDKGESAYDLRSIERQTFGKLYNQLVEHRTHLIYKADPQEQQEHEAAFRAIATTMAQHLKHYASDEEDVQLAEKTQRRATGPNPLEPAQLQDNIETLRHAAGLKLPQESNPEPESVGAEQL